MDENLERWRYSLERREIKVRRSETEYMCVIERKTGETVKMQGAEVVKVDASDRVRWRQMVYCGDP